MLNSLLNSRLDILLIKHKLINPFQIGFTKDSRPSDHLFVLKTLIDKYLHKKEKLFACLIDFRKAFDTVAHTAIYLKLLDMNVGGLFYNLIKDMHKISTVCAKVGQNLTDSFESSIGVRQGDVLSRNLFKSFINYLPDYLLHSFDPVYINNNRIDCLLYADDVILLSNSQKGLQSKLDSLELFCKEWCMSVNLSKTKVVIFNKSGRFIKQNFLLNNKVLDCCNSYKYLGITFSSSGSFTNPKLNFTRKPSKLFSN